MTTPLPGDPLAEYRAAVAKIDEAVARSSARAADALACKKGCASCCVAGLSVLPVEAAALTAIAGRAPAVTPPGMCVFLDEAGACTVYEARPVLCRTHGLALQGAGEGRGLKVLDDVTFCVLNFTARAPRADEALDAQKLLMLLVTVDRRYRARVGLPDDGTRVALTTLAADARVTSAGRT